mmetsp:Transcript_1849/g.3228  ORF Transcript_1849/g.3228 Transcript_1849/m.3228 type:complete len:290 (-) Transcript_1849:220-1089(-)
MVVAAALGMTPSLEEARDLTLLLGVEGLGVQGTPHGLGLLHLLTEHLLDSLDSTLGTNWHLLHAGHPLVGVVDELLLLRYDGVYFDEVALENLVDHILLDVGLTPQLIDLKALLAPPLSLLLLDGGVAATEPKLLLKAHEFLPLLGHALLDVLLHSLVPHHDVAVLHPLITLLLDQANLISELGLGTFSLPLRSPHPLAGILQQSDRPQLLLAVDEGGLGGGQWGVWVYTPELLSLEHRLLSLVIGYLLGWGRGKVVLIDLFQEVKAIVQVARRSKVGRLLDRFSRGRS